MSISAMKLALEALENTYSYLPRRWGGEVEADQAISALRQDIAEAEKQEPLVWMNKYGHVASFKNDEYTAPLYTAPVHASDISQERVDETAKGGHDLVYRLRKRAEIRRQIPDRKSVQEGQPDRIADLLEEAAEAFESAKERGWVGLTDEEIYDYADKFLYTHGSNYGIKSFGKAIEAKLKEKNT
jgi:hypothetical protein